MFPKLPQTRYLFLLLLVLAGMNSYAQKINLAVKLGGGLAYQHVENPDILAVNTVGSFSFGGMVSYNLPYLFELQSGLNIARKGAIVIEDAVTTTQRVTTLDVPLSLVKKIKVEGLGIFYVGGGGYVSTGIGGNVYLETPNSATSDKLEFGNDKDLRGLDAGLNFTAGLKVNNKLLVDLTYQYGLKNIASARSVDTGTPRINSRMFTASLGYTFK